MRVLAARERALVAAKKRICLECLAYEAMDNSDNCGSCDGVECHWCGLTDDDDIQLHKGDLVCFHCANGHQRVLWRDGGGTPVHGPCNCEVA